MARRVSYSKEYILNKSVEYVKKYGYKRLTVRELSKYLECSTQPIFKNFKSFDDYKRELKQELRNYYEEFVNKYIDETNYLFTISMGYAMFAMVEPRIFESMFMSDLAGSRTVSEVLTTDRNVKTIEAMEKQYNISLDKANNVYRDVRFYTHGISTQLCVGSIKLTEEELSKLILNNINNNLKGE